MRFHGLQQSLVALFFLSFASSVLCDFRNWNPTGQGCVDPKGYLSCYDKQSSTATSCVQFCNSTTVQTSGNSQNCLSGCSGAWLAGNLGCWIQSCWNQVYSCEYQLTALSYFDGTDLIQNRVVPFYPPPDDATLGACSCNLGYVYGNKTFINMNTACTDVAASGNMDALYECDCCEYSFQVSNILNVCPKSDLSILGFQQELTSTQDLISRSADECAILDNNSDTCGTQFGFPFYGKITNPLKLPAGEPGTEPLSNLPGNAFTEFGADTFTLTLFPGYSSVIKPAPFNANAGVATGSVGAGSAVVTATSAVSSKTGVVIPSTGKATGSSGSGSANTGSASAPSSTAKSGAVRTGGNIGIMIGGLVGFFFLTR